MAHSITEKEPSKGLVIAAFAALYIFWGSTYLGNLLAIKTIPPFIMAGTRFLIAGIILYIWCMLQREKTPSFNSILKISFSGIMMLAIGTGAVIWVEQYIPSGLTAVIVATVPLWFVILDKREWKYYFSNKLIIIGLLVGFAGVLLLFAGKGSVNFKNNKMQLFSFFILLAGNICWAIGSLYSRYKPVEGSTPFKAAIQLIAASIASYIFALLNKEQDQFLIQQVSLTSIIAVIYLVLFGSLVGYIAYIWLLSVRPPSIVGTYAYVNPVVAVFLGWLIVGEQISKQQIIALCVALAGVIMVNLAKEK
jgi:drug/metabolite transporter (DMT)-like permease